jgi:hypothetical protein
LRALHFSRRHYPGSKLERERETREQSGKVKNFNLANASASSRRRKRGKDGEQEGRLLSEIVKLNYVPNKVSRKNYYTIFRAARAEVSRVASLRRAAERAARAVTPAATIYKRLCARSATHYCQSKVRWREI